MPGFRVLTSRKRILIALIHTIVFLGVAIGTGLFTRVAALHAAAPTSAYAVAAIYLAVSAILLWLTSLAARPLERAYFAFCATSACLGLLRQIAGDSQVHPVVYLRIVSLGCAVLMGLWMHRATAPSTSLQPSPTDGAAE
jgi:hypothetical protein